MTVHAHFNRQFEDANQNPGPGFNNGGFNNGGFDNGFQNGGGLLSQQAAFNTKTIQQQGQAQGNSAAAGNAAAQGLGSASSINQADHQANQGNTRSSSLSANTAQGTLGSQAGGAAQAGGSVQNAKQIKINQGFQSGFQRFKRQYNNYYGGFGRFPQSQANGNSIGGGSALLGRVATNNNAFSQTSPYAATGFAAGNSMGEGQGVNIFQAANTNAASGMFGRRKRQIGYGGFDGGYNGFAGFPQSSSNANSLGGGSALFGQVATNNNAFSNANPYGAQGFAAGNALGDGQGVNIWNAANSNSASGYFG